MCSSVFLVSAPANTPTACAAAFSALACLLLIRRQPNAALRLAAALAIPWLATGVFRSWRVQREPRLAEQRITAALELGRTAVERSVQELLWLGEDLAGEPILRASTRPEAEQERRQAFELLADWLPWTPDRRAGAEVLDEEGRAVAWAGWVSPTPLGLLEEAGGDHAVVGLVEGETYVVVKTLTPMGNAGAVVTERALQVSYPVESRFLREGGLLEEVAQRTGIPLRILREDATPPGAHLPVRDTGGGVLAVVAAVEPSGQALGLAADRQMRRLFSAIGAVVWCLLVVGLVGGIGGLWGALALLWGTRVVLWESFLHIVGGPSARTGWDLAWFLTRTPADSFLTATTIAATAWLFARAMPRPSKRLWLFPAILIPAGAAACLVATLQMLRRNAPFHVPSPPGPAWVGPLSAHGAVLAFSVAAVIAGWIAYSLTRTVGARGTALWAMGSLCLAAVFAAAGVASIPSRLVATAAILLAPLAFHKTGWSRCLVLACLAVIASWAALWEPGAHPLAWDHGAQSHATSGFAPSDRSVASAAGEIAANPAVVAAVREASGPASFPLAYRAWAASSLARDGRPSAVWVYDEADGEISSFAIGMRQPPSPLDASLRDTTLISYGGEQAEPLQVAIAPVGDGKVVVAASVGPLIPGRLPKPLRPDRTDLSGRPGAVSRQPERGLSRLRAPQLFPSANLPEPGEMGAALLVVASYAVFFLLPVGVVVTLRKQPGEPRHGFRRKLTLLFLLVALSPVALLTLASLQHLSRQMERSFRNETVLLLGTAQTALAKEWGKETDEGPPPDSAELLAHVADIVGEEVSFFRGGELQAASHLGLYEAELLPTRMNGLAFKRVELEGQSTYVTRDWLGSYPYVVGYAPVRAGLGGIVGTVCLPRIRRQEEIDVRLAEAVRVALTAASALGVVVVALGSAVARRIARPLRQVQEATSTVASSGATVAVPVPSSQDEVAMLVTAFNKMSRQVASSRMAVEEKRRFMEAVVSHLATGVMVVEPDGSITLTNPSAQRLLQLEEDVTARSALRALEAPWLADLRRHVEQKCTGQGRLTSPGVPRIVQFSVTELPPPSGSLIVLEDVTEAVEWQRSIAWAQMARHVAHEVKNPLTPIKLSAQHLEQVAADDDSLLGKVARRAAGTIATQADRLEKIAWEFSTLARAGTVELTEVDLNRLVSECVGVYGATHVRGVTIHATPSEGVLLCRADPEALRRVLFNLIDNSLGATSAGGSITVGTTRGPSGTARITVDDTGCGIPAEHLQEAFEPGFTTKPDGTGLGLAIVKEAVERMGGAIGLQSVEGKGTTVTVDLQLVPDPSMNAG